MAEGIRRTDILEEDPRRGESCGGGCGEPAELVCYTPVYNGVYSTALRVALCQCCAMELAEHIDAFWRTAHEHATTASDAIEEGGSLELDFSGEQMMPLEEQDEL